MSSKMTNDEATLAYGQTLIAVTAKHKQKKQIENVTTELARWSTSVALYGNENIQMKHEGYKRGDLIMIPSLKDANIDDESQPTIAEFERAEPWHYIILEVNSHYSRE